MFPSNTKRSNTAIIIHDRQKTWDLLVCGGEGVEGGKQASTRRSEASSMSEPRVGHRGTSDVDWEKLIR